MPSDFRGLVLVNGRPDSVQGPRARALFGARADVSILYKDRGRLGSIAPMLKALRAFRGDWIYAIDLGIPGSPLAALRKKVGSPVKLILELGDPARPLLTHQGRNRVEVAIADRLDRILPPKADALVFRGSYLAEYFQRFAPRRPLPPALWLPDGVDTSEFRPRRDDPEVIASRREQKLEGRFVVGFVGSLSANPVVDIFSGWELAEALALLPKDSPVTGVVVGDGAGLSLLEAAREKLKLGDRLRLVGRVPHSDVSRWMNVFDVGLSTQTDDPIGWGRTTAKLPEYLACGTPVLCTDVGEAHRLLADSGQTLPYHGMRDAGYPERLAERLRSWCEVDLEPLRRRNRELAIEMFDYDVLRPKLEGFLAARTF